jgi:hypothetical protein
MSDTPPVVPGMAVVRGRRLTWVILWAAVAVLLAVGLPMLWRMVVGSNTAPDIAPVAAPVESHPEPLAETAGEEGTLKIEVISLDRLSPSTVELRLAVTHVGSNETSLDIAQRFSADGPDRGTLAEVYLADLGHQRKLFILREADGSPLGSRDDRPLSPRERRVLWARYPAPGPDDRAVVVHVPHAEPMPNVPVGMDDAEEPGDESREGTRP